MSTFLESDDGYFIERPMAEPIPLSHDDYADNYCDECNRKVLPDDEAPACGAHRVHTWCRDTFACAGCDRVWVELTRW